MATKAKTPKQADEETVFCGYESVRPEEKTEHVRDLFTRVSRRYDVMNDLMSGGLHRLWKDRMMDWVRPRLGQEILDLASGTGDIALRMMERMRASPPLPSHATAVRPHIWMIDLNPAMLAEGRARFMDGLHYPAPEFDLRWVTASAESLPLADSSIDQVTIAFGIRNVARMDRALQEIVRVLKPGGCFTCLEFSPAISPVAAPLYDIYSFHLIPLMGRLIARDEPAYRYLVESIRTFPAPEDFAARMREAGLQRVRHQPMNFGVVALHQGWKI
jgi:demethylmenaquinone methyltransferase/2-methoxy-6-polyprenyl-1,4-benzoquinol methylase